MLLEVKTKNTNEVVRFSLYAHGIEEYGGKYSVNTSGGYAYGDFYKLHALKGIVKEHSSNLLTQ